MRYEGILPEAVDRIGGEPIGARMAQKAPIRHLDPTLMLTTAALTIFGALLVFSATVSKQESAGLDPGFFLKRQLMFAVAGALVMAVVASFDYRHLRSLAPLVYGGTIVALVVVLAMGEEVAGAKRWINLGFLQLQPSEFAKLFIAAALAAYLAHFNGDMRARHVGVSVGLVAIPMVLIFLQPDLGTTLPFVALLGVLLLVGGAKIRHFVALGLLGLVAVIAVLQMDVLQPYQVQRLIAFLEPNPDIRSEGYNLRQSEIAIGSGGIHGKGLRDGDTQTALDFVPEQHTDFIFTAVGEQLGFIGAAALLCLFAFLLWRALRIAAMARDLFGTLLAAAVAGLWGFQLFVNVGMTMGIMPITGIPLPFISYGGSSLLTNFAAAGLLMNVHMRRFLTPR